MTAPDVTAAWREEWTRFAETLQRYIPEAAEELSDRLGDVEPAWREFLETREHLQRLAAWAEANPLANVPTSFDAPDLTLWPQDIPPPPEPPTPEHELELLRESAEAIAMLDDLRESIRNPKLGAALATGPTILHASAVTVLGYALAVREVQKPT